MTNGPDENFAQSGRGGLEMGSLTADRAVRVCSTCKARKKGCDKQLPQCGYCSKRGLSCNCNDYATDALSNVTESTSPSGEVSIAWSRESEALRDMLFMHVRSVLQSSGLSLLELSEYFFRTFHTWFPVISPALFRETALAAQYGAPPAEFSTLVLAIYLIVQRRRAEPAENRIRPEDMYVTVKVLFAQSQAVLRPSTTLVQASLLITAYEYATRQPDAAYVSIGTCIRMAQTIGLAEINATKHCSTQDDCSVLTALEERNVWWAIVILER
jgi:hypothetical protein